MHVAPSIRTVDLGKRYALRDQDESDSIRADLPRLLGRLARLEGFGPRRQVWALRHVSLEIQPGEVVGVIGPNGAGKSTLGRVLSRITLPTEGHAELRGRVGSLLEIGLGFHWELTGRENLQLGGAMMGMAPETLRRRFDAIVAFAGIDRFLDIPIKGFSTGMNLRLAFALAVHNDCDVLLIDEVLAVGDAAFQRQCLQRLRVLAAEGRTVLLISHQLPLLADLCGRVLRLDRGAVVELGPTAEVLGRYESDAAAQSDAPSGGFVEPAGD